MAKVKGYNPPESEFSYEDESGVLHYFGEFWRMIFGGGSVSPSDPETDFIGKSRRGERPSEQGEGTEAQRFYRRAFKNCTELWNALPEECPEPLPEYPVTSKKSVWEAKVEFGVPCSYYDLFMRCCIKYANWHVGEMPDGDCFPCTVECIEDPAITWDYDTSIEEVARGGAGLVAITGLNAPFTWNVSGTGFSLAHGNTEGLTNTLDADETACGTATITVTGCDGRQAVGYVRCTTGRWVLKSHTCGPGGAGTVTVLGLNFTVELIAGNKKQYIYYTHVNSWIDKDYDVGCVESKEQVCVGEQDCLTFSLPCQEMWGGSAYSCSGLECVTGCTKLPYTNTYRLYYVTHTPEYSYSEWEC